MASVNRAGGRWYLMLDKMLSTGNPVDPEIAAGEKAGGGVTAHVMRPTLQNQLKAQKTATKKVNRDHVTLLALMYIALICTERRQETSPGES